MSKFIVVTTIRSWVEAKDQAAAIEMFEEIESTACLEIIKSPAIAVESVKSFATIQG